MLASWVWFFDQQTSAENCPQIGYEEILHMTWLQTLKFNIC